MMQTHNLNQDRIRISSDYMHDVRNQVYSISYIINNIFEVNPNINLKQEINSNSNIDNSESYVKYNFLLPINKENN